MLAEYYSFILDTCLDHVNSTQSNQVISDSCTERLKAVIFNIPAPSSVDQVKCLVIHSPSTLLGTPVQLVIKGILHPTNEILSSFTDPQVVHYEFLSSAKHKIRYFEECR